MDLKGSVCDYTKGLGVCFSEKYKTNMIEPKSISNYHHHHHHRHHHHLSFCRRMTQQICETCVSWQEDLLASGDGSQVSCRCLTIDVQTTPTILKTPETFNNYKDGAYSLSTKTPIKMKRKRIGREYDNTDRELFSRKNRKFLSDEVFDNKVKQNKGSYEIRKWREVPTFKVFRVSGVHKLPSHDQEFEPVYAELADENGVVVKAWLTKTIQENLRKYDLTSQLIYIKSLGLKTAIKSGREYYNFHIVVRDSDSDSCDDNVDDDSDDGCKV